MAHHAVILTCDKMPSPRLCHTPCFGNVKFDFTINRFDPHSTLRFKWWKVVSKFETPIDMHPDVNFFMFLPYLKMLF
jgi:hypothetical protein